MNGIYALGIIFIFTGILFADSPTPRSFKVIHQMLPAPIETNCYLLYDEKSGEAALVDVGGPVDTLISVIEKKNLKLKYIFITHCHPDHVYGLPAVKKRFPDAQICLSRADYEDAKLYSQWESKMNPETVAEIKKFPEAVKIMNFDLSRVCKPDIFLEDDQTYRVGDIEIRTIFSPGHSRGSVCYYGGKALFSGDVLFYRNVGRTDMEGMSWESLVSSVRRLYSLLPDETMVYPGHGQFTTIGSEKKDNTRISEDKTNKP
jgi:glyoxylase-like metal-dependent hydrolase (beta-lactamase superfamily II)